MTLAQAGRMGGSASTAFDSGFGNRRLKPAFSEDCRTVLGYARKEERGPSPRSSSRPGSCRRQAVGDRRRRINGQSSKSQAEQSERGRFRNRFNRSRTRRVVAPNSDDVSRAWPQFNCPGWVARSAREPSRHRSSEIVIEPDVTERRRTKCPPGPGWRRPPPDKQNRSEGRLG